MAGTYALSKIVYKELRDTIGPWAKAHAFGRRPDTPAGWQKDLGPGRVLYFQFEVSAWGDPDIGNSLTGLVQFEPHPGGITATPIRQEYFTSCLLQRELDRLAKIQGVINVRRPPVPADLADDVGKDTRVGDLLRSRYEASPAYREGQIVPLAYYTLEDVRDFTAFIVDVLDPVMERFVAGYIPPVIDTTPPQLRSKAIDRILGRFKP